MTTLFGNADSIVLTLAQGVMLVSPWKPILMLLPFLPWAWVVSKIFDKHALRFYLPRETWNLAHMAAAMMAAAVAVFMPIEGEGAFWAGLGAACLILGADVAIFIMVTNRDERVPEAARINLLDMSKYREAKAKKDAAKKQAKVELVLRAADKSVLAPPNAETPEFTVRTQAEALFIKSMDTRCSQIDLAPSGREGQYQVSTLVDGVRNPGETFATADAMKLIDFWKSAAKLDVAERRKRQQADLTVERADVKKKVRLTSIGGQGGLRLTWLLDPEAQVRRKIDQMGFLDPQMADIVGLLNERKGVVLLGAPLDSGRTTTMYTLLRMHDAYTQNVQTVELDIQDSIEGSKQNKWDAQAEGPEYSTLVRSILRREPDVLGVAELPDANTAKEIMRVDKDRVRVYVSLRAESAMGAMQAWLKLAGTEDAASACIQGVIAQRLVRKLCTNCRVGYTPPPEMVKKLGLPPDKVKQLYKKGGQVLIKNKPEVCPLCSGTGYTGQEGVFEVLTFGDDERALLKAGDFNGLRLAMRKRNLPTIQQTAIKKAIDGITSVEEITRVTAEAQPAAAAPAAAPAAPKKA